MVSRRLSAYLKKQVRRVVFARVGGGQGIDLPQIEKVPERLIWPLLRNGADPIARLGEVRDRGPVAKLTSFLGMTVWLVTGDAESRAVLGEPAATATTSGRSSDSRGARTAVTSGDSGSPTRPTTPGCGSCSPRSSRCGGSSSSGRDRADRGAAARRGGAAAAESPDGVVDLVQHFAFPVPFLVICELLGLPDEERETFRALASAHFDLSSGGTGTFGAMSGSRKYLMESPPGSASSRATASSAR